MAEIEKTESHSALMLFYAEAELQLADGDKPGSLEYFERESRSFSLENQSRLMTIQNRISQINASSI